jgi:hypothetical protein
MKLHDLVEALVTQHRHSNPEEDLSRLLFWSVRLMRFRRFVMDTY